MGSNYQETASAHSPLLLDDHAAGNKYKKSDTSSAALTAATIKSTAFLFL
jgi:hypothetical protein